MLSPRGIDGVYDILNFMTGDDLFTHQLLRAANECKPFLLKQFPELESSTMGIEIENLDALLNPEGRLSTGAGENIVKEWLAKLATKHGTNFWVEPIPKDARQERDPFQEAAEMVGDPSKIIVAIHD